jgi:hypothetical protein
VGRHNQVTNILRFVMKQLHNPFEVCIVNRREYVVENDNRASISLGNRQEHAHTERIQMGFAVIRLRWHAAMRLWAQGVIEEALGDDAPAGLPEAIRLVELRARVPRYQREMLRYLAQRGGTSVDEVLTRELEDVACAHSEELAVAVPGFEIAFGWSESAAVVPN